MTRALHLRWRLFAGATLIEMVVSLFVMGVGMMGVLGLQTQAMRTNQQAYAYSQAVFLSQEILERIRANPQGSAHYRVDLDERTHASKNCGTPNAGCSAKQLRDWDIASWQTAIAHRLPAGKGQISVDDGQLQILLEFDLVSSDQTSRRQQVKRQRYLLHAGL